MPPRGSIQRGLIIALIVLVFGVALTAVIDVMGWDLAWTATFYQPGGPNNGWVHAREFPWNALYDYGEIPGLAPLAMALVLYVVVLIGRAPRRYARPCMVIVLTIALGPGLLVNGILKDYWGRPRPAEISNFGGDKEFRPVWKPGGPRGGEILHLRALRHSVLFGVRGSVLPCPSGALPCRGHGRDKLRDRHGDSSHCPGRALSHGRALVRHPGAHAHFAAVLCFGKSLNCQGTASASQFRQP